MDRKNTVSLWRILFVICAVVGGVGLAVRAVERIALAILLPDAASIGIIGGADGPTAIFVTTSVSPPWYVLALAALLLIGLWGCFRVGKHGVIERSGEDDEEDM